MYQINIPQQNCSDLRLKARVSGVSFFQRQSLRSVTKCVDSKPSDMQPSPLRGISSCNYRGPQVMPSCALCRKYRCGGSWATSSCSIAKAYYVRHNFTSLIITKHDVTHNKTSQNLDKIINGKSRVAVMICAATWCSLTARSQSLLPLLKSAGNGILVGRGGNSKPVSSVSGEFLRAALS